MDMFIATILGILAAGSPLVLASLGETISERAGVVNLSLDGAMLLAAMAAFAVSASSGSPWLGFVFGGVVGAAVAGVLVVVSLVLGRSQMAIGFVLTLLCRDLAYFLGNPFARQPGPDLGYWIIPGLGGISPVIFLSMAAIFIVWRWLYYSESGLRVRSVGESPQAAFSRGVSVNRIRVACTLAGGFMAGLAGGAYSLAIKQGWGRPQGCEGAGWICLAIVIFGGWSPWKVVAGAYFFAALQVAGIHLQDLFPGLPGPVFQVAPFPIMILTLLLANLGRMRRIKDLAAKSPLVRRIVASFEASAPAALGKDFKEDM